MLCPNCESPTRTEDKIVALFHKCEKCYYQSISYATHNGCCISPNNQPVRFYKDEVEAMLDSDNYLVYNQCQSCGRKNGSALKKSDYKKENLHHFNEELVERTEKMRVEIRDFDNEIQKQKIENRRDTFWDDYNEYLKSEEWQIKRELVLKRDNNLCQSCLSEVAMEVHHKVGAFRKNEPLFSLVSLCGRCHRIITEIERGNHKNAEKIIHKK